MKLQFGSHVHDVGEVVLVISKAPVYSRRGYRIGTRERWDIQGVLQAASISALTTALGTLETAYATNDQTLTLFEDDGTTETRHKIDANSVVGGVKVLSIRYPQGAGAEYSTFRTFQVSIEAVLDDPESDLLAYSETVEQVGTGGPVGRFIQTLNGAPQLQTVAQVTTQRISQRGSAIGYKAYPVAASPLLPSLEHVEQRRISRVGPDADRTDFVNYRISWSYTFESPTDQFVLPTFL